MPRTAGCSPANSNTGRVNAFDGITYRKGAALLWMIHEWLGGDVFRKVLQRYVKRHEHQTATTQKLINVFEEVTDKRVVNPLLDLSGVPKLAFDLTYGQRARSPC